MKIRVNVSRNVGVADARIQKQTFGPPSDNRSPWSSTSSATGTITFLPMEFAFNGALRPISFPYRVPNALRFREQSVRLQQTVSRLTVDDAKLPRTTAGRNDQRSHSLSNCRSNCVRVLDHRDVGTGFR